MSDASEASHGQHVNINWMIVLHAIYHNVGSHDMIRVCMCVCVYVCVYVCICVCFVYILCMYASCKYVYMGVSMFACVQKILSCVVETGQFCLEIGIIKLYSHEQTYNMMARLIVFQQLVCLAT